MAKKKAASTSQPAKAKKASTKATSNSRRCVAFLRGVNLGKRTVKGPELIKAFSKIPLDNPTPFLTSGNVVFDTDDSKPEDLQRKIEEALADVTGFSIEVFLRNMEDLTKIAELNPFDLKGAEIEDFTVNAILLRDQVSASVRKNCLALRSDYDDFAFSKYEVFWLCRGKRISDSKLFVGNQLVKATTDMSTTRNIRTIQRLVAKFG